MRARVSYAIIALALLGMGVSAYLLYEHYYAPIVCLGSGCAIVDQSPYSEIFGVPLSGIGFLSYVTILGLAVGTLRTGSSLSVLVIYGLALSGTIFSVYLTYLEVEVIGALCNWCVTSAVVLAVILVLAFWELRVSGPGDHPARPKN